MPKVFIGVLKTLTDAQREELEALVPELVFPARLEVGGGQPPPAAPPAPPDTSDEFLQGEPHWTRVPGYLQTLIMAEWPRAHWLYAARITWCESRFNPRAHNPTGEDSRGLYQINIVPAANPDLARFDLFDATQNVEAAGIVWRRQGWRAWLNCARAMGIPANQQGPGKDLE